jgi:aldehyde:ferredoxin oxidoreductase
MGKKNPAFFDDAGHARSAWSLSREVGADIKKGSNLRIYGTAYVPQVTNTLGILPTRNFQTGVFEGVDKIDGVALKKKYLISHKPCYRCPISCGRLTEVNEGKYAGKGEGPEYETISSLGTACGLDDLAGLLKANYRCNELGMDTISTGLTIAAAMEMYEKGVIDDEQTGMPLRFGDADAVIEMVEKMAHRQGFGDVLAEGSYRLAERYDHPEMSRHRPQAGISRLRPARLAGDGLALRHLEQGRFAHGRRCGLRRSLRHAGQG